MASAFALGFVTMISGRYLLAFVFLLAGLSKFRDLPAFRASVEGLLPRTVPQPLTALLARLVPVVELSTAVGLMVPSESWPLVVSAALLSGFELVLVHAWQSGLSVSCNCFGSGQEDPVGVDALRTGLLLAICLSLLLFGDPGAGSVPPAARVGVNAVSGAAAVLALTAGAIVFAVVRLLTVLERTTRKGLRP